MDGRRRLFIDLTLVIVSYLLLCFFIFYLVRDKDTRDLAIQLVPGAVLFIAGFFIGQRDSQSALDTGSVSADGQATKIPAMTEARAFLTMIATIFLLWGWQTLAMEALHVELSQQTKSGGLKLTPAADHSLQFVAMGLLIFSLIPALFAAAAWVGIRRPSAGFRFFLFTTLATVGIIGALNIVQTLTSGAKQPADIFNAMAGWLKFDGVEPRQRAFFALVQAGAFVAVVFVPALIMWLGAVTARRIAGRAVATLR